MRLANDSFKACGPTEQALKRSEGHNLAQSQANKQVLSYCDTE